MKKLLPVLLIVMLVFLFAGCTTSNQTKSTETVKEVSETSIETSSETSIETSSETSNVVVPGPFKKDLPIKIAYVPIVMNTHYDMVKSGIMEGIDRNGGTKFAEFDVYAPTSNVTSREDQINILDTLLQKGDISALCLSTENEEAMLPYLRQFCEKGIPIFLFNMSELVKEDVYYVTSVGYDQYDASYKIGEWAVKFFNGKDTQIAVLEGSPGSLNTERLNGFKDAIANSPNLKIVASQAASWTRADGQSVTENLLVANPGINFIYGMYDEMALGALAAVKAAGKLDKIIIAGYDNTKDANASIKAGELYATVNTAAKEQGTNLINAIKDYCVLGKEVDKLINSTSVKVYDKSNIDEFDVENYIYVPRAQEQ